MFCQPARSNPRGSALARNALGIMWGYLLESAGTAIGPAQTDRSLNRNASGETFGVPHAKQEGLHFSSLYRAPSLWRTCLAKTFITHTIRPVCLFRHPVLFAGTVTRIDQHAHLMLLSFTTAGSI